MEITITVNNQQYQISDAAAQVAPAIKDGLVIECVAEISQKHVTLLGKILAGTGIAPVIDVSTHADVFKALTLAKAAGVPLGSDVILAGFTGWTNHASWVTLGGAEYLYLIYEMNSDLVDFRKFFRLHRAPFASIVAAASLPEVIGSAERYIDMLSFFRNFDFSLCFDENNGAVQRAIAALRAGRNAIYWTFMVNPYSEVMRGYFEYMPSFGPVWSCRGISVQPELQPGEYTIANYMTAKARFAQFTYYMFHRSPNPEYLEMFPFENTIVAGGSICRVLSRDFNLASSSRSDVDIFIFAPNYAERARVFEQIIRWFYCYDKAAEVSHTYYALNGCVATIYIKDVNRKFQVISSNAGNPYHVVSRFDLSHIQWCLYEGTFYGTPEACAAMRSRTTRVGNMSRLKTERLIKALHCGYDIYRDEAVNENTNLDLVLRDPGSPLMLKYIRELYGWYFPVDIPGLSSAEMRQHVLCMVERDSHATFVTDSPEFAIANVVIGGSFGSDYQSTLFSTFNPAVIINKIPGMLVRRLVLKSRMGVIKLTTPVLEVAVVTLMEAGLMIQAINDDVAFRGFCNVLENQVFKLFRRADVDKRIIVNNRVEFYLQKHRMDRQSAMETSYLRNQRGNPLDIEEELHAGDKVQILFMIEITLSFHSGVIHLRPLRIVKYEAANTATLASDDDQGTTAPDVDLSSTIEYEEAEL